MNPYKLHSFEQNQANHISIYSTVSKNPNANPSNTAHIPLWFSVH